MWSWSLPSHFQQEERRGEERREEVRRGEDRTGQDKTGRARAGQDRKAEERGTGEEEEEGRTTGVQIVRPYGRVAFFAVANCNKPMFSLSD